MKKISILFIIGMLSLFLSGCDEDNINITIANKETIMNENSKSKSESDSLDKSNEKTEKFVNENIVRENLAKYFEVNKGFFSSNKRRSTYNGYREYGYELSGKKLNNDSLIISYKGKMTDGYGEDERGERNFVLTYNFKLDEGGTPMAYEKVENSDYISQKKDTLNSIIKNYIVIWGEVKEGKSWEQKVLYNKNEHIAKTIVKSVSKNSYTLSTEIKNIDGFYNNCYKEERTYEKGKGLVEFSNTPVYQSSISEGEGLNFAYRLNEI